MNSTPDSHIRDTWITAESNQGTKIQASVRRVARDVAVFELHSPESPLRTSEVLQKFDIVFQEQTVYSGPAVVRHLVDTRLTVSCEVSLREDCWRALDFDFSRGDQLSEIFNGFITEWSKLYRVSTRYKAAVADLQTCLSELRLWADQIEVKTQCLSPSDRAHTEGQIISELGERVVPVIDNLFDRFEEVSGGIEEEFRAVHRTYGRRQLHPFLLCSPFMYRTYAKPLGFAGDYEMIDMIVRNEPAGGSLFAKLADAYLLAQAPPHAVRNRVDFLEDEIIAETARVASTGKPANIFDIACGPAREVERFLRRHTLAGRAKFTLLDFNEETLRYAEKRIREVCAARHLNNSPVFVQQSVQSLLRVGGKRGTPEPKFDLIYCSGLYDYLSDSVCRALNTYLYDQLLPGGLLVVGNFAPSTPRQNLMEHLMEWFLIYRGSDELRKLAPEQAHADDCVVWLEPAGANIFLKVRKPE
jgi:extracellular factor (EF) 3-hydroxypalmitic acid methyl ester biosynthesis protein